MHFPRFVFPVPIFTCFPGSAEWWMMGLLFGKPRKQGLAEAALGRRPISPDSGLIKTKKSFTPQ